MSSYDKNYSYVEMLDAFHAGRLSVINNVQAESGTWALVWIDEYTKARDSDLETREIDDRMEAEQEARIEAQEYEKDDFSITNLQDND